GRRRGTAPGSLSDPNAAAKPEPWSWRRTVPGSVDCGWFARAPQRFYRACWIDSEDKKERVWRDSPRPAIGSGSTRPAQRERTCVRYTICVRTDDDMRATDIGMVPLGYGRFVRADEIVAVLPVDEGRG